MEFIPVKFDDEPRIEEQIHSSAAARFPNSGNRNLRLDRFRDTRQPLSRE